MINIQPEQVDTITTFIKSLGDQNPQVFPMVRGRLVKKNDQLISAESYENVRAKRLITREFNLSMTPTMQKGNQLVAGQWWQTDDKGEPMLSIEEDIAQLLNITTGDVLTYRIAGREISLRVTSIRKIDWGSIRANFFVVTPPEALADYPKSYMTAFYVKEHHVKALDALIKQLPNLTIIDVASLMEQIRDIMGKMSLVVS